MTELARWLDERRPAPPAALRRALDHAVAEGDPGSGPLADRLAAAALATLERVIAGTTSREGALPLLAADALLTYACEAAIEEEAAENNDAVQRVTRDLGPERFARMLGLADDAS